MRIRINEPLQDHAGEPVREPRPDGSAAALTLREVVMTAFLAPQKGDEAKGARERTADYDLFLRFAQAGPGEAGEIDLTPEALAVVRERVARGWLLAVSGPALKALGG